MRASTLARRARQDAGLTLRELADRAHTSDSTLSAYETGSKDPRATTLLRVLRVTGTQLRPVPARPANKWFVDLLCERVADMVADDPDLLEDARQVLPRLEGRSRWVDTWRQLLEAGPVAVFAVLTSTSLEADALKTDNPFALLGLVSEEERRELLAQAHAT